MDTIPLGFRPCLSCTHSCYKEHWPFPNRDSFKAPCFVKALCDSNLAAMATCWMVIPSAWLKLYGDDVGNSAMILGPSGNTWQVGVSRPKWVAFRVGWRTFAADNCLEKGDMLVFTLIGKSKFSVKIFDSRTCLEKESSLTATNTGCYDSRSPVLSGEKRKQRDGCENVAELKRVCTNDNEEMQCGNKDQASESFRNGNDLHQSRAKISILSSAALVSQKKCSLLDLNSKPTSIHQNSSNEYGRSLPDVNQLQLMEAVNARTLQEYASGVVYQPHPISIRSHDLQEECYRQGQFKAQECGSGGVGPATRFAAQRRPVMDTTRERHAEYLCRQNSSADLITFEPCSQALDLNREHFAEGVRSQILKPMLGGRGTALLPFGVIPCEENIILFAAIDLVLKYKFQVLKGIPNTNYKSPAVILERGKALELARRAQDTIDRPSHLVVLRAFHVHGRAFVRFPVTFGKQHMPRKTAPMHLLDYNGHRWPMTWLRDNETHMGLTRGWRDFCLAEGLSEGDVCLFELIEFNKLTLLIHIFRSTETRGNAQVVITRSKRLDLSHADHQKPFERRKISEGEGRGQRKQIPLDDKDRQPATLDKQYSFMPKNLVIQNAFHRTTLPSSVKLNKGYHSCKYSTVGSVGRVRLKQLSIWASKSNNDRCLSVKGYSPETESLDGLKSKICSEGDVELNDGDMRKLQVTTYGENLRQLSSRCGNGDTNNEKAPASSIPKSTWMGVTGNDSIVDTLGKHEFQGRHFHVIDRRRNHGYANTSKRHDHRPGSIPGHNTHKHWAQTRKLYRKAGKNKTLEWSCSTTSRVSSCSALKRKLQASNRNSRFYIASRRSSVTQSQKEAAKEAALALKTENPTTLVVMKNSNVYNTYSVELPPSFSRQLSSDERISIFLSDASGHKTKANLTQSVITRGWRQFALEHLLEEGDVCVFELIDISHLTVLVHISRVLDVDPNNNYQNHYRFISLGKLRRPVKSSRKLQSNGQIVKENAAGRICQPRRNSVNKSLYLALRNTKAKLMAIMENEWFCLKDPLDLNLNLDPASVSPPVSIAPVGSPSRTISTNCAWSTLWKHSQEVDTEPKDLKDIGCAHQRFPISEEDHDVSGTSFTNIPKDIYETTSPKIRHQGVPRENEKMIMRLPMDEDDSEPEEEHYYRVVRILKKRYLRNEKQYLTELDGPVMHSTGCEGIRDLDDMKWWIPEKSFSSGFASCYLP